MFLDLTLIEKVSSKMSTSSGRRFMSESSLEKKANCVVSKKKQCRVEDRYWKTSLTFE